MCLCYGGKLVKSCASKPHPPDLKNYQLTLEVAIFCILVSVLTSHAHDVGKNPTWSGMSRTSYFGSLPPTGERFMEVSVMDAS